MEPYSIKSLFQKKCWKFF